MTFGRNHSPIPRYVYSQRGEENRQNPHVQKYDDWHGAFLPGILDVTSNKHGLVWQSAWLIVGNE